MKPVYTNYFVVRKNEINTEVILDFGHNYAGSKTEVVEDKDNGNKLVTKIELCSEPVGSYVLNMHDAIALRDTLNSVIFDATDKK